MKKVFIILTVISVLILIIIIGYLIGNNTVVKKYYETSSKVSNKIKIVQLTDIHSITDKSRQEEIVNKTNGLNPDVVLLTGDIITEENDNYTIEYLKKLNANNILFVSGNHEFDYGDEVYENVVTKLIEAKIKPLRNSFIEIDGVNYIGVEDIYGASFGKQEKDIYESLVSDINTTLKNNVKEDKLNILLMHRPHYLDDIDNSSLDYIFSGHVHGGQWQAPFELFAAIGPDQGILPKYFEGKYTKDNTTMFVSSGLERKYSIPRFFNPREIVYVEIDKE